MKNICYLGSSVTNGFANNNVSFINYLNENNYKEAVNGTTLVDLDNNSYISRLKTINNDLKFDIFVLQLSTNDATKNLEIGNINDINTNTICGAINYIIDYVKNNWNSKIIIYTNFYFENNNYQKMVDKLYEIAKSKNIIILDFYNKDIDIKDYMADIIHPNDLGYRYMAKVFEKLFNEL